MNLVLNYEYLPFKHLFAAFLKDIDHQKDIVLRKDPESHVRKRAVIRLQQTLIQAQEVGDEKLQIAQQVCDLIENKARQLELDFKIIGRSLFEACFLFMQRTGFF